LCDKADWHCHEQVTKINEDKQCAKAPNKITFSLGDDDPMCGMGASVEKPDERYLIDLFTKLNNFVCKIR